LSLLWHGSLAAQGLDLAGAEEKPHLVVYGPNANPAEGDPDYRQIVYIALPESRREPLYLRIFDADVGDSFDTAFSRDRGSTTRFSVYGGPGAFGGPRRDTGGPFGLGGHLLAEEIHGQDETLDARWTAFATLDPASADRFDRLRVFRFEAVGLTGSNGNVFEIAVSGDPERQVPVDGVTLFTYDLTLRALTPQDRLEVRFRIPERAAELAVSNFDASGGVFSLATPFRLESLRASENGRWRSETVAMDPAERGLEGAITFFGGREAPNDLSAYIEEIDAEGVRTLVALTLPVRDLIANNPPQAQIDYRQLDCNRIEFDGTLSRDEEDDPLDFRWLFHDGETARTPSVVKRFDGPGIYPVRLEVSDDADQVANGSALTVDVPVKPRPLARIGTLPPTVGTGDATLFDAAASAPDPRDRRGLLIESYQWDFGDGTTASGESVTHRYARPGRYRVTLEVRDDSGLACNRGITETVVAVNAPPIAEAGPDLIVTAGEIVTLDGRESSDPDGQIGRYIWDLGNGETAEGAVVRYAYPEPGSYTVTLTAEDSVRVGNSRASDSLTVQVRDYSYQDAPIADAGGDREVFVGEAAVFDAARSYDRDGNLLDYSWSFGNGQEARGPQVVQTFWRPGTYEVTLRVEDNSGSETGIGEDIVTVTVAPPPNAAPLPQPGGDRSAFVGERMIFDAAGSRDPDGRLLRYSWDFGTGETAEGETVLYSYQEPGRYDVTLTVEDAARTDNSVARQSFVVTVEE